MNFKASFNLKILEFARLNIPCFLLLVQKSPKMDFPGGPVDKTRPANAGDMGSIPGVRRFHVPWSS